MKGLSKAFIVFAPWNVCVGTSINELSGTIRYRTYEYLYNPPLTRPSDMSSFKVTYFNGRGRAELIRLLLVAGGQEFEDERLTREEWVNIKPNMPQGQVPVLTVDGKIFPQSGAIHRYLARRLGLYGKTNEEMTTNDIVMETVNDVRNTLVKAHFEQDDTKKKEMFQTVKEQTIPNFLKVMQTLLEENDGGKGFFVGSEISVGDLALTDLLDVILQRISPDALDNYELMKAHRERVCSSPKIKKWLETRPQTEM